VTTTNDGYRVKRPLTADELSVIFAGIDAATNTRALLNGALRDLYTPLLADLGTSLDNINAEHPLRTTDYAIPTSQWTAIVGAITDRAQEWGTAVTLTLDLVNAMPSSYEDPDIPAPVVEKVDRRPHIHNMHITREAVDVIAACDAHVQALGACYGQDSQIYLDALHSWHYQLTLLFNMNMGADTHISKDGTLSLFVATASGYMFGIIFHGDRRHCTVDGCGVTIHDDGTTPTRNEPAAEHEHIPSYPLDAVQPGQWSYHS
jgi:hypothetical protein